MRNFQDTFKTRKRSFISAFSTCMTVPLILVLYALLTLRKYSEELLRRLIFKYFEKVAYCSILLSFME